MLNAIYFLPLLLLNKNRDNIEIVAKGKYLPSVKDLINIGTTFGLTVFAWIFFRSQSISYALMYVSEIFSKSLFTKPEILPKKLLLLITIFFIIEWIGRESQFAIQSFFIKRNYLFRWSFYYVIIFIILIFAGANQQFIYFQF